MLKPGLYEQIINKEINKELTAEDMVNQTAPIDSAEGSKVLAKYMVDIIEKGLDNIVDDGGDLLTQVDLVNKIVELIKKETNEPSFEELTVDQRAEQLLALYERKNSLHTISPSKAFPRPETSIAQSSLFTGTIHEPSMYAELKKEILTSDRIDMLVSFIKWSGLRLIIDELAYVFYRNTGFTTAYVGSSNLSNAAISSGLEWNVKATAKDLPETVKKINATFESYWNSNEFEFYYEQHKERLSIALRAEKYFENNKESSYIFDIIPYPYQQEILDKLAAERTVRGQYRNLVVAATGTGKTVISAFDYKQFCTDNKDKPCRLLFIAHREEILKQSINCFKGVLKDPNFGELFVGNYRPEQINHLFMSIQTFNSQAWHEKTSPEFYDYIIVDEFHHAAALTYQRLLRHYNPKVLLGLTATPERMDGQNVTHYFNDRIAAEIRLPEAIDRKLLCPFQYFGVTDTVDLDSLKWSRGGYEKSELTNVYTLNTIAAEKRCNMIIASLLKYVTDISEVKGLGFCVSIAHAEFMANYFNDHNIASIFLTGNSSDEDRDGAKKKLVSGEIRFIFVVDIYNEGVDIPEINTILFLRPTESLTVFLQQLGRGLRLADNKECLTVLDFIGQANKKYNFEDKFAALLNNTTRNVQRELKDGFVSVPKGCFIQLERKAKEYILDNIRSSFGAKAGLVTHISTFEEDTGKSLSLQNFIEHYHLDIRSLYIRGSFSRLCVLAGVKDEFEESLEDTLTKAFPRICAIDSRRWIKFLLNFLNNIENTDFKGLLPKQNAMLRMFYRTIWQNESADITSDTAHALFMSLAKSPVLLVELIELLTYNYNKIDFIDESLSIDFDCPLDVHCTYTRDQLLLALDFMKPETVREGVKWLPDKKCDVFLVTLNKSDKEYSPTTMYNDYSINEWLFHWQSQSTTSEDSPTGKRYINHRSNGSHILLFVREFKKDITGAAPYTFLGAADYIKHEGSRPMSITWKLKTPITAKYLRKTNKLVVG